ncbi:MAG: flagellar hook capping FlgD N-terminal domain-containing protein [Desulfobacterales bacterium]
MTIAAIEATGVSTTAKAVSSDTVIMGKDDFLNLLVAQLQHQDPLNPLDSTDFTAQLAQFTSLEQLNNINTNLESLQSYQAAIKNAQAVDLIGKTVEASGNTVVLKEDSEASLGFDLTQDVQYLSANIYGPQGNFVRTIEGGSLPSGRHTLEWDGRDQEGNRLSAGQYSYEILATDLDGEAATATPFISARVTGVNFDGQTPQLKAGDYSISVNDIREVTADASTTGAAQTDGLNP